MAPGPTTGRDGGRPGRSWRAVRARDAACAATTRLCGYHSAVRLPLGCAATTRLCGYHSAVRLPLGCAATTVGGGYHREWAPRSPGDPSRRHARREGPQRRRAGTRPYPTAGET
ncbi:hypothetical protein Acsp02_37060 [Actinoplanes sp. NBRC 103695]|nr:hypothetical protein Acsp02_37060 [Actinoplanes sp. NBRC 103695]